MTKEIENNVAMATNASKNMGTQQKNENNAAVLAAEKQRNTSYTYDKEPATLKKWLYRAWNIDYSIKHSKELIEMWKNLASKITSAYGGSGGASGFIEPRLMKYLCQITDEENKVRAQLGLLVAIKVEISDFIACVPSRQSRDILESRYIMCKSWEEIAKECNYSQKHISDVLHATAIAEAQIIFNNMHICGCDKVQ